MYFKISPLAVHCGTCCFIDLHVINILFIINVKMPFFYSPCVHFGQKIKGKEC